MSKITVSVNRGDKHRVDVEYRTGCFAVHKTITARPDDPRADTYTVTHVPTGRVMSSLLLDLQAAKNFAKWVKERFEKYKVDPNFKDPQELTRTIQGRELSRILLRRRMDIMERHFEAREQAREAAEA